MTKDRDSAPDTAVGRFADEGGGTAVGQQDAAGAVQVTWTDETFTLKDGAVVIAAITPCTNTSNPAVMLGAGLLARNARKRGLTVKPWGKTSLAPGTRGGTEYLATSGRNHDQEAAGG